MNKYKYLLLIMILLCPAVYGQTISQQLQDISDAKAAIKAAIESKGVTVDSDLPLHRYDDSVRDIIIPDAADNVTGYLATDTPAGAIVTADQYFAVQAANPTTAPSTAGYSCAVSGDGNYAFFGSTTTNQFAYKLNGGLYERVTIATYTTSTAFGAAMSSDGALLVLGTNAATAKIQAFAWSSGNNRYEQTAAVSGNQPTNAAFRVGLSSDGSMLAVSNAYDTGAVRRLYTYKWSSGNNRYEETAAPDTEPDDRTYGCGMSGDGNFVAIADVTASPYLYTYKWDSADNRYELTAAPDEDIVFYGYDIALSNNGAYLAVGTTGSPYLKTYTWDSEANQYKVASAPNVLPSGQVRGIAISQNGDYLAVGSSGATDNITTYMWSPTNNRYEITASASLTILTDVRDVAMTSNGRAIVAAHNASSVNNPYFTVFGTNAPYNSYQLAQLSNPVAPTASVTTDCIGYTHSAGSIGQSMTITALYNTNPYVGSDFLFDAPTQTITGYRGTATEITVPSQINGVDVLVIGREALKSKSLTSVTISSGITTIKSKAFYDNSIATLTLPNSITTIGDYAFDGNALTSVTLPTSLETLGGLAFANNLIASINIPNSVTSMGSYCWYRNKVTDAGGGITIGTGLTFLNSGAFSEAAIGVWGITSITIPSNIGTISNRAFYGAPLTTITMASATTSIYNTGTYTYHRTMGNYGEGFVAAYGTGGAGTYNYSGGVWTKE